MATIALMGPPGSGKSCMAGLTAPGPVHFLDIDRKVKATARLQKAIQAGEITYKEIGESFAEGNLKDRLAGFLENKTIVKIPPKGWTTFANYVGGLENDPVAKNARTIVLDTATQLGVHMWAHIQHVRGKGKFVWDDWNIWKNMWMETVNALIDYAANQDKHLIVCLHERVSEKPGDEVSQVRIVTDAQGQKSRDYLGGKLDVKVAGSIDGSFGLNFGTYFTDVYALRVDIESETPIWKCRVHPDGQRDLRCSFPQQFKDGKLVVDFEPSFKKIWGPDNWK